jgi:hypothetical protein
MIALSAATVWVLLAAAASAELGWTETDYVKHFGAGQRAPRTPNEARFSGSGGGSVLVVFADGRSTEEAWSIDRDLSFVPAKLLQRARAAVKGKPVRRVQFHRQGALPAEIFEVHGRRDTLQVDYRNGGIIHIVRCPAAKSCTLMDRLLGMERVTDDLLTRLETQMRREGRRSGAAPQPAP